MQTRDVLMGRVDGRLKLWMSGSGLGDPGMPLLVSEFNLRGISLRGATTRQMTLLPTLTADRLVPPEHPIRRIKGVPPG